MITFRHRLWEKYFKVESSEISVLAVENSATLWTYCTQLLAQSEGGFGDFSVSKNFIELAFEKICVVETDVAGLSLNTKKIQNALVKKCVEQSAEPEFELRLRKLSLGLYDFCKEVCSDTGYSIDIDEDMAVDGLFKLFSPSFKKVFPSFLEKMIEYINVYAEFTKAKIFIFLFLTKFLSEDELSLLAAHCRYQDVSLILIEETFPSFLSDGKIPYQGIIIDSDDCEIAKNLSED